MIPQVQGPLKNLSFSLIPKYFLSKQVFTFESHSVISKNSFYPTHCSWLEVTGSHFLTLLMINERHFGLLNIAFFSPM